MHPQFFGIPAYMLSWLAAVSAGVPVGVYLARRNGFATRDALPILLGVALAVFLGSKLLFFVEHTFFPLDDPMPVGQESFLVLARHGFRIPGGILILTIALPLLCRWRGVATLAFADAVMPTLGVAIIAIRLGCLCNGCCFGAPTSFPIAMTFPPGARVFFWQASQGLIGADAAQTLPVHPLQVYFALLGLALYLGGRVWQARKQFDGEVWANFNLLFFGGTFLLELLRPTPLHLNLILVAAVAAATLVWRARARRPLTLPAGARS